MFIEYDLSLSDHMKTEYGSARSLPWWLSWIRKPLRLCSTAYLRMAAKLSTAFLWKRPASGSAKSGRTEAGHRANSECQDCRSKGARGMQSPFAELRGASFLSGCRGEASLHSGSRVQSRPVKVMRIVTLYWVLPAAPKEKISFLITRQF